MISEEFKSYRQRIIDYLKLLSSAEEQRSYQKESAQVNVPDELLCMWFDDLAMPGSLKPGSSVLVPTEVEAIERFSEKLDKVGVLIRRPNEITLEELLKHQDWQNVIVEASSLLRDLKKRSP